MPRLIPSQIGRIDPSRMPLQVGRIDPTRMPDIRLGYTVAQMPQEQLEFHISFNGTWEQAVQIYDQDTATLLTQANNYFGGPRTYIPPASPAGHSKVFAIFAYHKKSRPNGRKPWFASIVRELDGSQSLKVVGFEDGGDGDFNDAKVEIRFRDDG